MLFYSNFGERERDLVAVGFVERKVDLVSPPKSYRENLLLRARNHDGGCSTHIRRDKQWIGEDEQHHPPDQQVLQRRYWPRRHLPQRHSGLTPNEAFLLLFVFVLICELIIIIGYDVLACLYKI